MKRDCFYSLWVTAELPENIDAGEYGITIKFLREGEELSSDTFYLKVVDAVLPEGEGAAHENPEQAADVVFAYVNETLEELSALTPGELLAQRQSRFARF